MKKKPTRTHWLDYRSHTCHKPGTRFWFCVQWLEDYFEIPAETRSVRLVLVPKRTRYSLRLKFTRPNVFAHGIYTPDGLFWYVTSGMWSQIVRLQEQGHVYIEVETK